MSHRPTRPARPPARPSGSMVLAISAAIPGSARAGEGRGIAWRTDFAAAEAEARARNLPLWVQFTGPWCIYCKKMDMFPFVDPAIVARSQSRFVPVKIRSDAREDLVAHFRIGSLPSTVILSPSGKLLLGRSEGYSDAAAFASVLDSAWANALADPDVLAISGYCPVRLVEGKGRVKGDARLAVFHDGHAYRFADASARDLFLKDPEKYLPSDGGRCVVTRRGLGQNGRGRPSLRRDLQGPPLPVRRRLGPREVRHRPRRLPRCGLGRQRGLPALQGSLALARGGQARIRRDPLRQAYLFPDETHRQAFRAAPDRYVR